MTSRTYRRGAVVLALASVTLTSGALAGTASAKPKAASPDFTLTILHANDLESALLPTTGPNGVQYGGVDRFVELIQQEQQAAGTGKPGPGQAGKRGVLTISAGDNFLPGPQLAASGSDAAQPIYDATAFAAAGFDVSIFGNHDFDQTPDFLARWLDDVGSDTAFVSGNLGFAAEPALLAQVQDGTIVRTHVEKIKGEQIGIIGLTTPELPRLTSSRGVTVDPDLAGIANAQAAAYAAAGVDKVVLVSHLQDIDNEVALAGQLRGVDVIVGGGGHELLADAGDPLVPNGASATAPYQTPYGSYPLTPRDAEGKVVPVVTTNALYSYVGRLVVTFDDAGNLLAVDDAASRPLPVIASGPGAQPADPTVTRTVVQPVQAYVESLRQQVVATSQVPLNGARNDVRSRETNLGDLVADSLLAAGRREAAAAGVTAPVVAIQNGGGIRNASVLPAGPITALDTYTVLPFANFVAVAPAMPVSQFLAGVERGLTPDGGFAQVAGYRVTYRAAQPVGSRIVDLTLDDGTVLVRGGVPTGALQTISVATNDFTLRGGDGYPFDGVAFTVLPVTYQQALATYLTQDLGGVVSASRYPVGGTGRITAV
ncbi:5'-nucleotidase C-terminal domain-containing protein [Modestobacter sp. VKM Ac-2986]|uniref:bifunctional metallophosphatase/5'-nucleotidase n=1 Tax=Modestobacter sp. VKM Ac-2986 TaxID=3004140 RepID=UPI0022AB76E1|nr:5'-nucleotidase C-terminal domain-containing protein [Modestobacter sp. VKM Ac-2986]MCZ2830818.1 5'-nucleotidase C-terminal domain-containing protein [Modestobacter sp. VKM Ac-2986]